MEPQRLSTGGHRIQTTGQPARDQARQNVAAASDRQPTAGRWGHHHAQIPVEHDRVRAFGDDGRVGFPIQGDCLVHLVRQRRLVCGNRPGAAEPRQFARVRGQHHLPFARPEPFVRSDQVQRIGIDHGRRMASAVQHLVQTVARQPVAAKPRPDHNGCNARVGQGFSQRPRIDDEVIGQFEIAPAGQHFDIARPAMLGRARGMDRRAWHCAGHDHHQPAGVFVRIGRRSGQPRTRQQARRRGISLGGGIDADLHQPALTHQRRGGHHPVRPLPRPQRDGQIIAWQARIQHRDAIARHPARQVDRDQLAVRSGQPGQQREQLVRQGAGQAGAEQAIDQHPIILSLSRGVRRRRGPQHLPLIQAPGSACRAGLRLGGGDHCHRHAAFPQRLRYHIAIAAVVAGPAQHGHAAPRRHAPDPFGRAAPGALHQIIDRGASADQRLLGGAHLRCGQDPVRAWHAPGSRSGLAQESLRTGRP